MITKECFGEIKGREVSLYILKNDSLEVTLSDYGATIIRIRLTLKNGEVRLVRQAGRLVSCEGFPLWGVVDNHVVSLTPWQSVESRRAQEVFRRAGISVTEGVEVDESKLTELFYFGTNELVSVGRAWGRVLEPFVAFRLADYL